MGGFGTFTHYTTVQIAKDGNFAKYVKIIRAYDGSLGMGEWEFDEYCDSLEEFLKEIGAAES